MSDKRQHLYSVFNFKKKKQADDSIENDEDENLILVNTLRRDDSIVEPHVILEELKVLKENEIGEAVCLNDVANFVVDRRLTTKEIHDCLTLEWVPPATYAFPEYIEGKQKRRFLHKYLTQFPWLAYSKKYEGAYCKFCVVFAFSGGGVGQQKLGKLVKNPMVRFKEPLKEFQKHQTHDYHLLSAQRANDFLLKYNNPNSVSVDAMLNENTKKTIENNRRRLVPIIKTILFCARHNLPLRGHHEQGNLESDDIRQACLSGEQGVFRGLLSFRIECGDTDLWKHFEEAPKNCTLISPQIQNEIIESIGNVIEKKIVERVKLSKFFSILCDETTDRSTVEQMTICVRYVDTKKWIIREDFLGFIEMKSTTGTAVRDAIKNKLQKIGLSMDNLRGQGYDGGANMSGKNNGVQALILKEQPLAFYTHCFSHSLNLCISKACEISSIKNMMGVISVISSFFSASAKRTDKLKSAIEADICSDFKQNKQRKTKLKKLCDTRWIERHNSIMTFKELYVFIVSVLEDLQHDANQETSSKATMYLNSVTNSNFLVSLEVSAVCFAYTVQLSVALQSKQQDLSKALSDVLVIKSALQNLRDNVDNQFKQIFNDIVTLGKSVSIEIKLPRICKRQTQRINFTSENPEIYFKRSIFIPFLDFLIESMDNRFNQRLSDVMPLEGLIPANFNLYDDEKIIKAAKLYTLDLDDDTTSTLRAEMFIWREQWKQSIIPKPMTAIESVSHCTNLQPNIQILLRLFATLPVTSSTPERTFSTLNRTKTYLRSSMSENRLNGLAMANINKNEDINENDIITAFAQMSPRRMQLTEWNK